MTRSNTSFTEARRWRGDIGEWSSTGGDPSGAFLTSRVLQLEAGQHLGVGLGGALCLGIGTLILLVGLLRFLQTQTGDVFDGNWSFVPYVIVLLVTVILMAIVFSRIQKHGLEPREPRR